jgi:hypothetical protein
MSDNQKLRLFLKGLKPEIASIIAMNASGNVTEALTFAQHYENGQDLINYEQPSRTKPEKSFGWKQKETSQDPVNDLVERFEKMHLKLAERIENIATQVEKKSKPAYKQNNPPQTTYAPERETRTCFKCGQQGHLARNCLSERPTTYQTQYAPQ